MPRRPTIIVPGTPLHIIQRGNNRQACFFAEEDYLFYLDWLKQYAKSSNCAVHAFVLMTNHVHLLLTPKKKDSAGSLMKRLGQRYVQYVNRTYQRSGTLWEGRFRSCIVQQETYLFICQKYIEMNPVRAMMVDDPGDYQWSSYQVNGLGKVSDLCVPHQEYLSLGVDPLERQKNYQGLFIHQVEGELLKEIRDNKHKGMAIGSERFKDEIEILTGRRLKSKKRGRPTGWRKKKE